MSLSDQETRELAAILRECSGRGGHDEAVDQALAGIAMIVSARDERVLRAGKIWGLGEAAAFCEALMRPGSTEANEMEGELELAFGDNYSARLFAAAASCLRRRGRKERKS